MRNWFKRLLEEKLVVLRGCDSLREIAVLWFVFAMLDKLVEDELTFGWAAVNSSVAIALWVTGTYIEVRIQGGATE
ncbi:MAG TPA: hypothetical protein VGF28_23610 [Thermoanaerobaculia bacterium]|jgi:hypothetical protein